MSVIKEAFVVNAHVSFVGQQGGEQQGLSVEVQVDDQAIRSNVPRFDGIENVFALVPRSTESGVAWTKTTLQYTKSRQGSDKTVDLHRVFVSDVDAAAVAQHGVAIGLETNTGVIWAQRNGENFKANVLPPVPRPRALDARLGSMGQLVGAMSNRISQQLDGSSLVAFARAQADLRIALSAPDATSELGLARIARFTAGMKDTIEEVLWTPISRELRASLERLENQLGTVLKVVRDNI